MNETRLEQYKKIFHNKVPIARYFGMKLSFKEDGSAVIELPYNPNLDHGLGGVHGGVYATLLDTAGWFTAATAQDIRSWVATADLSVRLLEVARKTSLRAEGRLIKAGKRQNIVEMSLYDDEERLVGYATGSFMILHNVSFLEELLEDDEKS